MLTSLAFIFLVGLSLAAVCQALKKMEIEPEIVCMQVSRAEKAGPYHLMKGENPVYILSFGGAEA